MLRTVALLLLTALILVTTWMRTPLSPSLWDSRVGLVELRRPSHAEQAPHLGPFMLERIWQIRSTARWCHGFSSLVTLPQGQLLAFTDRARWLRFSVPDQADRTARPIEYGRVYRPGTEPDRYIDVESATRDPQSGAIWVAQESANLVARMDRTMRVKAVVRPRFLADWGYNSGAEAMVRLADGRFLLLREVDAGSGGASPTGLLYSGEPKRPSRVAPFHLQGPPGFRPTDAAQLPDGRVLVLLRRLAWPLPLRFSGRIAIGDPAEIRAGQRWRVDVVAKLTSTLPVDNFEGMAIEPRGDGTVTVWLISDDNNARTQRTLLWKLRVDPSRL